MCVVVSELCVISSVVLNFLTLASHFFPNQYRHLSKSFSVPLSQVVSRLFVDCKAPEQMKHALDFIIDPINRFRRHMFPMFHILGSPPVVAVCTPSGPHAVLFLLIGRMLEFFVDAVVFFDIFVWFATGEIDSETHAIIP